MSKITLIGIGQSLRGDDAIGITAVQQWRATHPENAQHPALQIETAELPGLALLDMLTEAKAALLVDAVQSGRPPGTIHRLTPQDLAAFLPDSKSAHGWGVAETLQMGKLVGHPLPEQIIILAIEAADFELGAPLSPAVQAKLPEIIAAIQAQIIPMLSSA